MYQNLLKWVDLRFEANWAAAVHTSGQAPAKSQIGQKKIIQSPTETADCGKRNSWRNSERDGGGNGLGASGEGSKQRRERQCCLRALTIPQDITREPGCERERERERALPCRPQDDTRLMRKWLWDPSRPVARNRSLCVCVCVSELGRIGSNCLLPLPPSPPRHRQFISFVAGTVVLTVLLPLLLSKKGRAEERDGEGWLWYL